jgi:hypothetical protein
MASSENSTQEPPPRSVSGRVRWRRFAILFVPALAAAATLIGLTAEGVLAANISVSGSAFEISSSQLQGTGFVQFGGVVTDAGGHVHPVAISGIQTATLADLCQSVSAGPFVLRLTAGSGGTPVSASNLVVDADQQTGSTAIFHNITIGQDASTLTEDPGVVGPVGAFSQQASSVTIDNLQQNTWLTTAGTFTLPGLSLSFGKLCY